MGFEKYPNLTSLPIYAWGRYYKYECAGGSFETDYIGGFGDFYNILKNNYKNIDWELLDQIDNDNQDKIDNADITRGQAVKIYNYDDRGGNCLIITKSPGLSIISIDCDSPE